MAKSEEISFTSAHEIKADRRILKTKKAIYEALVELMQKKKLNSITVTELAAQADINRKTFYTYYSTVNDVLDEGINELSACVPACHKNNRYRHELFHLPAYFISVFVWKINIQ